MDIEKEIKIWLRDTWGTDGRNSEEFEKALCYLIKKIIKREITKL